MSKKGNNTSGGGTKRIVVAYPKKGETIEAARIRVQRNHPGEQVVVGKPNPPHTTKQ